MRAQGKIVVITGASMGIGEALAKVFLEEGASVVISSRDLGRAQAAQTRLFTPDRTLAVACDVCKHEQVQALLLAALDRFGRVDVWVNNAGHGLLDSVSEMSPAEFRRLMDTNLFGAVDCMQAVIPVMKQQGSGVILNIASVAGHIPVPYMAAYSASKFALIALSKAARLELLGTGVSVIAISPGYIATDFGANAAKGKDAMRMSAAARNRMSADDCARVVFNGYLKNGREVIVPWTYKIPIFLYDNFPGLTERFMRRMLKPAGQVFAQIESQKKTKS